MTVEEPFATRENLSGRFRIIFIWLLFTFALLLPGIQKYRALHTHHWDMGIFQTAFWNYSPFSTELICYSNHFRPIFSFYSAIYKLLPYGETLMVLQSLSLSVAIFVLYAYARDVLGRKRAYWVVYLYCLSSPIWLINLSDFHPDSLVIPLGLLAVYFQKKNRWVLFALSVSLLLCVKEISFFIASLVCLYGAIRFRPKIIWFVLSLCLLLSGILIVDKLIPNIEGHSPLRIAGVEWLGSNMSGLFKGFFENPIVVMQNVFTAEKAFYILMLFGPFLFIPFLASASLLPALPGISLSLLSNLWRMHSLAYQYPAVVMPFVFIAFVEGLHRVENLKFNFIKATAIVFVLLNSAHLGFFLFYKNDSYHYSRYFVTSRDNMITYALETTIPKDDTVVVSSSNLINHSILANRKYYLEFPHGVFSSDKSSPKADYIIYDRKRVDELEGFAKQNRIGDDKPLTIKLGRLRRDFESALSDYDLLYNSDSFYILKRKE